MAGHLSAIGFEFADAEQFRADMLELAAGATERLGCPAGDYAIWRSRTGAEIWFHLPLFGDPDEPRDIAGLTPFFEGESEVALQVTEFAKRPGENPFEGIIVAHPEGSGANPPNIRFEAADFAVHTERSLPFSCTARLVGFAHRISSIASTDTTAAQGIQPSQRQDATPQSAFCIISGRLVEQRLLVNELTGNRFHRLTVNCEDLDIDVVAAAHNSMALPEIGKLVKIECTLFGRLLD